MTQYRAHNQQSVKSAVLNQQGRIYRELLRNARIEVVFKLKNDNEFLQMIEMRRSLSKAQYSHTFSFAWKLNSRANVGGCLQAISS